MKNKNKILVSASLLTSMLLTPLASAANDADFENDINELLKAITSDTQEISDNSDNNSDVDSEDSKKVIEEVFGDIENDSKSDKEKINDLLSGKKSTKKLLPENLAKSMSNDEKIDFYVSYISKMPSAKQVRIYKSINDKLIKLVEAGKISQIELPYTNKVLKRVVKEYKLALLLKEKEDKLGIDSEKSTVDNIIFKTESLTNTNTSMGVYTGPVFWTNTGTYFNFDGNLISDDKKRIISTSSNDESKSETETEVNSALAEYYAKKDLSIQRFHKTPLNLEDDDKKESKKSETSTDTSDKTEKPSDVVEETTNEKEENNNNNNSVSEDNNRADVTEDNKKLIENYKAQIRKARDEIRKQDIKVMSAAIELYHDKYNKYPTTASSLSEVFTDNNLGVISDPTFNSICGESTCSYLYKTNGLGSYELSVAFESDEMQSLSEDDNGNDEQRYEVGVDTDTLDTSVSKSKDLSEKKYDSGAKSFVITSSGIYNF